LKPTLRLLKRHRAKHPSGHLARTAPDLPTEGASLPPRPGAVRGLEEKDLALVG